MPDLIASDNNKVTVFRQLPRIAFWPPQFLLDETSIAMARVVKPSNRTKIPHKKPNELTNLAEAMKFV